MKYAVLLLVLMFAVAATASMAQNPNAIPTSQSYKTSHKGFECHSVTKKEDCERCGTKGEYGQVSTPEITCSKCKGVSTKTLSKFPCSSCSNTRKVKDPNYVPPRKCEDCNGRGKVLALGHKIQVADADYTDQLSWYDANYVCARFGDGWRLPTIEELTGMYEFLHMKGNFDSDYIYWSSSGDNEKNAWFFNFRSGRANNEYHGFYYEQNAIRFRAVRDLSSPHRCGNFSDPENFVVVEEMPSFPGGDQELLKFMVENTNYPQLARENGLQGIVVVTFVVDGRGRLDKVQVLRGIGGGCDEEAIRVVKAMPQWKPGKHKGMPVCVQYNLTFRFTLR